MANTKTTLLAPKLIRIFQQEKPVIRNEFDAVCLAFHFLFKEFGFQSVGCGDKEDMKAADKYIPDGWNNNSDSYTFHYLDQKKKLIVIKFIILGESLLVHAMGPDQKIESAQIDVKNYVKKNQLENYENLFVDFENLISLFRIQIVNKFAPRDQTERKEDTYEMEYENDFNIAQQHSKYEIEQQQRESREPFRIGERDLFPPLGFPSGPSIFGPSGNIVGPNHPGFGPVNDPFGGRGPMPGRGGYPRGRFDPFGPPGTNFPFGPDHDHDRNPFGGGGII